MVRILTDWEIFWWGNVSSCQRQTHVLTYILTYWMFVFVSYLCIFLKRSSSFRQILSSQRKAFIGTSQKNLTEKKVPLCNLYIFQTHKKDKNNHLKAKSLENHNLSVLRQFVRWKIFKIFSKTKTRRRAKSVCMIHELHL